MDECRAGRGVRITVRDGTGRRIEPNMLAVVFDILLTALEIDEELIGGTWVRSCANAGYKGSDTAYADDLLSTTPGADQLQHKANIVSAFCSIMGLQIFTTKLRRFVLGAHEMEPDDARGSTIVHSFQWQPEVVQTHTDEALA